MEKQIQIYSLPNGGEKRVIYYMVEIKKQTP